jgi:hypothetical protein
LFQAETSGERFGRPVSLHQAPRSDHQQWQHHKLKQLFLKPSTIMFCFQAVKPFFAMIFFYLNDAASLIEALTICAGIEQIFRR